MAIKTGQVTLSGTPQPLTATEMNCTAFEFRTHPNNTNAAYWGPDNTLTTANGHAIGVAESYTIERRTQIGAGAYDIKPSGIWVVGTAPDIVTWVAFL